MLLSHPPFPNALLWILTCSSIAYTLCQGEGDALSDFIRHYEPVFVETQKLKSSVALDKEEEEENSSPNNVVGGRQKRSGKTTPDIRLQFTAHNRVFRLRMHPDTSVFAPDVVFESSSHGRIHYDTSSVLRGILEDEEDSTAVGVLTSEGLFDGLVTTKEEDFYIEPASRYFGRPTPFQSLMYKSSDVVFPESLRNSSASLCCGHPRAKTDYVKKASRKKCRSKCGGGGGSGSKLRTTPVVSSLADHQKPLSNEVEPPISLWKWIRRRSRLLRRGRERIRDRTDAQSKGAKKLKVNFYGKSKKRKKVKGEWWRHRSSNEEAKQEHSSYWRELDSLRYKDDNGNKDGDSEPYGVRSVQRTHWSEDRQERHVVLDLKKSTCMLYLQADHLFYMKMGSEDACIETMTRHVQKVNSIYRNTDFDQDGRPDNISFLIKRIKVHTADSLRDSDYRFPGNYGVEKFLELFSEEDYDAFCLAYMFTYRDFEGGTLGLAWTGDLKNAGGVCEKNGHYRGSLKSLNTGIVTLLNYGKHVPPIVSHVTLAHEIGHNFGSPHDPEDDKVCTPGDENGNYIMFARATSGDKKNNNKFSPCSLKSINAVLNTKARSVRGCFTELQHAICGNEVVEPGEECDCGWAEDCEEPCCFPMRNNPPPSEPPCRLRPRVNCSPSQGPCCTNECSLKVGDKCREDNGCRSASYCDGRGPKCPSSINKPNKTICNDKFVCYMGECTGSICIAYGLESCQCRRGPRDPITKACELCCRYPGDDKSCKSSFEWNEAPFDVPDMYAKPGTPCDNYNGYCDVFQKCREVDPSGPLATLRRLLLSTQAIASLQRFVLHHWWALLIACLGAMLFLVIVVRCVGRKSEVTKSETEPDMASSSHLVFQRSLPNQGGAKGRNGQSSNGGGVPTNQSLVAALTGCATGGGQMSPSAGRGQGSTSPVVRTTLNGEKPLAMNGNGWV